MEINLKKALSIFAIVCFSTTALFAGTYDQEDNSDMDQSLTKVAVPPAVHADKDGPSFFITADYTYWVARQDGLAYAVSNEYGKKEGEGVTFTPSRGSVFYPNWKGRSGFKVGAGSYLGHDGWDLYAEYTWFYNKQQKGVYNYANFTPGLGQPTWPVLILNYLDTARAFWANWFNRIDLQLAKAYYAGHYLQLRPFIGLLGAWDQQWYNINYGAKADSDLGAVVWANNQKWWGVGPWTGFETAFLFPWCDNSTQWSLFLDFGSGLPWAQSKVIKKSALVYIDINEIDETIEAGVFAYTYDNYWNVEPMLEVALGLRWEMWCTKGMNWNFMLQAAWEEQVWFAHNHIIPLTYESVGAPGNYSMQGFTLKGKVGF